MLKIENGTEVANLIKDINSLINQNLRREFGDMGFTIPQLTVIGVLSKYGPMKISDLSQRLSLSNSTISGIVDRLEKQNIVERERSEKDKRVVFVQLSAKYKALHKGSYCKVNEYLENSLKCVTEAEIHDIINGLKILKSVLEK